MPKEVIYGESLPFGEDNSGRSIVEISWSKEAGHVQMATKCVHAATGDSMRDVLTYTSKPGDVVPDLHASDGWYVDLDREGINRTIRNLRRARDQAYGRDE